MRRICSRLKSQGVKSAAASVVLLMAAAGGAMAQSVPGDFYTNQGSTTYTGNSTSATITLSGSAPNNILQWGGSFTGGTTPVTAPSGQSANNFSIGSGSTLTMTGGKGGTLVNDISGSQSLINGALIANGLPGPLYIANAKGVIVGSTGSITAPTDGAGLLGYAIDASSFDGTVSISKDQATSGSSVIVEPGATVTGGLLLAAGTDLVNVALKGKYSSTYVSISGSGEASATSTTCDGRNCTTSGVYGLAGEAFSTNAGSVLPVVAETPRPPRPPKYH